ncbi:S-adenosylmethionine decarboxylase [Gymnopilus junonius]|uniref:adenosylmethionine decarboxylase n=1 Tax=Gymnopilus junonius TaxID=109634 RepID=A0A9P5TKT3_GYMJU|nr:S-adenosylmethionine decarboxylase [Gymnopilus junonius]
MSPDIIDDYQASAPFEGPEKLLEIWFAQSAADVPPLDNARGKKTGLRTVSRQTWEDMLDIVRCKVLSVIQGDEMDAYLLSESSFFVSPHRLILKTCGTTLNLLGLPRILEIAAREANLTAVYRFFYSRKSFMFPERQFEPHRDWKQEIEYLDRIFKNGAAYTVGKVNGDHWLLYLTTPDGFFNPLNSDTGSSHAEVEDLHIDYTIEILMSDLSPTARQPFFFSDPSIQDEGSTPLSLAAELSEKLGISNIFPPSLTHLDAYAFQPCGYSSNALIKWGHESLENNYKHEVEGNTAGHFGEGYYTIHVTPEEGWSYASFECNVPLSTSKSSKGKIPDLKSLIKRVVDIFEPGRITLTLFISSEQGDPVEEPAIEEAQRVFKAALTECAVSSDRPQTNGSKKSYKRTDKINYEFGGYDLAFASFELK